MLLVLYFSASCFWFFGAAQDVSVTMVLPQRQGIALSFDVYITEPSRVKPLRTAFQRMLTLNHGRELCQACGVGGLAGLIGTELVVLQPMVRLSFPLVI